MLTAVLIINEKFSENGMHYFSFGITLASSMIGGLIAGKRMGGKYAFATFLTGGIYCLVLIGAGILLFDGLTSDVWTTLVAIGIGSICACAICISGKGRGRKRKTFSR
jgi:putative membrane protein (TIGR04086 family)